MFDLTKVFAGMKPHVDSKHIVACLVILCNTWIAALVNGQEGGMTSSSDSPGSTPAIDTEAASAEPAS